MSYEITAEVAPPPEPPKARPLTPIMSNYVASMWLALGFGILLLLILWPELGAFLPGGFNFTILLAIIGGLVGLTAWLTRAIVMGNEGAMKLSRTLLLVGLIVLLAGTIGFMVWKLSGESAPAAGGTPAPNFFGASPLLSASLLSFAVLLPLLFAMMGFFLGMRDEVDLFFNPPAETDEDETQFRRPRVVDPAEVEEQLAAERAAAEAAALEAEMKAQEAALVEEVLAEEEPGEVIVDGSDPHAAAYEDHEAPLSMGELSLDEPEEEKKD